MRGDNFVKCYENVLTDEECKRTIEQFEVLASGGFAVNRQQAESSPKNLKQDLSCSFTDLLIQNFNKSISVQAINDKISEYMSLYETGMFGSMQSNVFPASQAGVKVQKTNPSEGYHVWHCENSSLHCKGRFLTWILYLNTIEEGGETEFIHLSERVKPVAGTLVVFPAGWTHTHRGNPPLLESKYIMTGWMEYTQ